MFGWMGRILNVDLSRAGISEFATEPYSRQYLGGRAIASRLYWEKVAAQTAAFDPQNHLILMTGPLTGSGAQGATRMALVAKSPMTLPEQYCYGNLGGWFPAELKKAGYDGIVISGRAAAPVYLLIQDNHSQLCDATALWGQGANRTAELIAQAHGRRARFITTGPAGENRVRSAIIFGSHQSTSTAGFGAVMGSKNLKAVVVKGSGRPAVARAAQLKQLNRYTIEMSKRLDLSVPPDITQSGHGHLVERIGKGGCYQCALDCIRNQYRYGRRPELVANRRCQSMEYYLPWKYAQQNEPVETLFDAPTLANEYGLCTFELRNMINWLYACRQACVLSEADTGLPLDRIGTREFLEKLLSAIARREGFGDLLAEGLVRAAAALPEKVRTQLHPMVQPVGELDVNMPRSSVVHALLDPLEPRMNRPLVHAGFARTAWMFNVMRPGSNPITSDALRRIARAFWGSAAAADLSSYEGKALAAVKIQNRNRTEDSLGLCDFAWPLAYSFSSPGGVGDPDLEAKIFAAVTGEDEGAIDPCIDRLAHVQRLIQRREGRRLPADDFPADDNFSTPLVKSGPMIVPGPGNEPVSVVGKVLDREKYLEMLREYYRLRGWDEKTGVPRKDTLIGLGLEDMIKDSE